MFQGHSIRIATVVALGVLLALCGGARAGQELKAGAAAALEVRVLQVQTPRTRRRGSATMCSTVWRSSRCSAPPPG
jgi:hypothetical protein